MNGSRQTVSSTAAALRDSAASRAGLLLLLTAAANAIMVYARLAADADQSTLLESMRVIAANKAMYSLGGTARLISGITLIAGAWFLLRTWVVRERFGTPVVPYLFLASGAFTAVSGVCALTLAAFAVSGLETVDTSAETVSYLRWFTGKIGFSAAGLALVAAALRQWRVSGAIGRIAPASAVIGIAMQLIWVDAATIVHRISGAAFFVWLIVIGIMLVSGRVERHFSSMRDSSYPD